MLYRSVYTGESMDREGVDECSKDIYNKVDKSIGYLLILWHEVTEGYYYILLLLIINSYSFIDINTLKIYFYHFLTFPSTLPTLPESYLKYIHKSHRIM